MHYDISFLTYFRHAIEPSERIRRFPDCRASERLKFLHGVLRYKSDLRGSHEPSGLHRRTVLASAGGTERARWRPRGPGEEHLLQQCAASTDRRTCAADSYRRSPRLATVKHYRSLIQMAQEHRRPVFSPTRSDGAMGSVAGTVVEARRDIEALANIIRRRIPVPDSAIDASGGRGNHRTAS